jgi:hypothetical protein
MQKSPILSSLLVLLLVVATSVVWAHEKVKLTGYVVDVMCFGDHAKDKVEDATRIAAEHTKECALMDDCVKSGYGLYADGKWYPFDAKGNELAKALFDKTKRSDHLKVIVEGMKHEDKILVEKLTEAE